MGKTSRKGFFIGEHFASLDHIPDDVLTAFFQGRGKFKAGSRQPRDDRCFNCGSPDHYSKKCPQPRKCFGCGSPDHVKKTARIRAERL